jgi:hypothetical protein
MEERCLTCYHCIKNRDVGYKVGTRVYASLNFKTGKLASNDQRPENNTSFDDGTKPKSKGPVKNKETEEEDF